MSLVESHLSPLKKLIEELTSYCDSIHPTQKNSGLSQKKDRLRSSFFQLSNKFIPPTTASTERQYHIANEALQALKTLFTKCSSLTKNEIKKIMNEVIRVALYKNKELCRETNGNEANLRDIFAKYTPVSNKERSIPSRRRPH